MRFKKILAGITAAALAVGSLSIGLFASGESKPQNASWIQLVINSGDDHKEDGTEWQSACTWAQESGEVTLDLTQYAGKYFSYIAYQVGLGDEHKGEAYKANIRIDSAVLVKTDETEIELAKNLMVTDGSDTGEAITTAFEGYNWSGSFSCDDYKAIKMKYTFDPIVGEPGEEVSIGTLISIADFDNLESINVTYKPQLQTACGHSGHNAGETYCTWAKVAFVGTGAGDLWVQPSNVVTASTGEDKEEITASADAEEILSVLKSSSDWSDNVANVKLEPWGCDIVSATCVFKSTHVTRISLNKTELSLKNGETETLEVTFVPTDATNQTVTWSSSDEDVATVEDGVVKAVGTGSATITAVSNDNKNINKDIKATCEVTVTTPAKDITVEPVNVLVGESKKIAVSVDPEGADEPTYTFTPEDPTIATVDAEGNVTGVKAGSTTVKVTAEVDEATTFTKECAVTVTTEAVPATKIVLEPTELKLEVDGTATIKATLTPAEGCTDTVTWTSSKNDIVKVDNTGKVTAVAVGEAVITAKANDDVSATCKVTVSAKTIAITSVTLDKETATVEEEGTVKLIATVNPSDTTEDKTVTWKSSDETVATVKDGVVTGVKAGKATITATAGTKSAECEVTVTAKVEEPDTMEVYEFTEAERALLADVNTVITVEYNSPNGWNDIGFGASLADESWASAALPAQKGDGTLTVTVKELLKEMTANDEPIETLEGVTYFKIEGYNKTVLYSVEVKEGTDEPEDPTPTEGLTATAKLYTQGNGDADWAWKDGGDDLAKTVTVSKDAEPVELKWTIEVDEKVDSAAKFSAGGLQIAFDDPDCKNAGVKVNVELTDITIDGTAKDDIAEEYTIVKNWNASGTEIMVPLADISFENVGKEFSCKLKVTPVSADKPEDPDNPGEDETTTTTKVPEGFYVPGSTPNPGGDTTTTPGTGSTGTPVTPDTTVLEDTQAEVKVEFAAGTVKTGATLDVKKSGETATSATFDITLKANGVAIQPDGTLTITITVPAGLLGADNYYVYRVETDGTYTDMLATFADGKVTFKTGHLSEYIISTIKLTNTGVADGDVSSSASVENPDNGDAANTGNADQAPNGGAGSTNSGSTDDKNVPTGLVIAFIPAAAAAAAVIISKKRK